MFGQPNPSCPPWLPQAMHKLLQEYTQGHLPWVERFEVCVHMHTCSLTVVSQLFTTPWTIVHQAPLSMKFSWQECWSGLPIPPPELSSQLRDQTRVSCIGRWILYLWVTWEAQKVGSCCQTKSLNSPKLYSPFLNVASLQQTLEFISNVISDCASETVVKVVRQIPSAPYSIFPKISIVGAFLLIQRKQLRNCVPSYFSREGDRRETQSLCVYVGKRGRGRRAVSDNLTIHKAGIWSATASS